MTDKPLGAFVCGRGHPIRQPDRMWCPTCGAPIFENRYRLDYIPPLPTKLLGVIEWSETKWQWPNVLRRRHGKP